MRAMNNQRVHTTCRISRKASILLGNAMKATRKSKTRIIEEALLAYLASCGTESSSKNEKIRRNFDDIESKSRPSGETHPLGGTEKPSNHREVGPVFGEGAPVDTAPPTVPSLGGTEKANRSSEIGGDLGEEKPCATFSSADSRSSGTKKVNGAVDIDWDCRDFPVCDTSFLSHEAEAGFRATKNPNESMEVSPTRTVESDPVLSTSRRTSYEAAYQELIMRWFKEPARFPRWGSVESSKALNVIAYRVEGSGKMKLRATVKMLERSDILANLDVDVKEWVEWCVAVGIAEREDVDRVAFCPRFG